MISNLAVGIGRNVQDGKTYTFWCTEVHNVAVIHEHVALFNAGNGLHIQLFERSCKASGTNGRVQYQGRKRAQRQIACQRHCRILTR